MSANSSAPDLDELYLVFARSRRRAAVRHVESKRRWPLRRRVIGALVLAVALLSLATARSPVVAKAPAKSKGAKPARTGSRTCGVPAAYAGAFRTAARETRLPLPLLAAVAWEESRMNPHALSTAGARGILQLMPATAKALATAPADPRADILAGRLPGTAREAFRRQRRARARRVQRGADGSREARPSSFARDAPLRQERRGSRSQARGLLVPHKRQERRALRLTAPKSLAPRYAARRSESFAAGKFRNLRFSSSADIDAAFRCRIARKRLLNVGRRPRSPNPSFCFPNTVISATC